MGVIDPYRNRAGCTCNNLIAAARSALEGRDMVLCPVHQADEIAPHASDERDAVPRSRHDPAVVGDRRTETATS